MDGQFVNDSSSQSEPGSDQPTGKPAGQAHLERIEKLVEERIGDMLLDAQLIDKNQLQRALNVQAHQGGEVVKILISMGYVNIEEFIQFLAKQPALHRVDLTMLEIAPELIRMVPRWFAEHHTVMPIDRDGDALAIGVAQPLSEEATGELETIAGMAVKPVLCSAKDLHTAIQRYYVEPDRPERFREQLQDLQAPLRLSIVARLVRQIDSFPALPETVQRVRMSMDNPASSVNEVANIIIMDPPVAAKVLSVANSAAYGFPQRIENVPLAITLMGLRETYSIVLSAAVLNVIEKSKHIDYKRFWVEALCCAAATRFVMKAAGRKDLTGAFAAGLLHDIGRVALAEVAPELCTRLGSENTVDEILAAEEQLMGMTHMEAGYELAQHWGLPPDIAESIRHHHRPALATTAPALVAVVCLADAMARATGKDIEENKTIFNPCQDALEILQLDDELAEAMLNEFLERRDDSLRDAVS